MREYKILIIGKTPPPIGGVTIHVNRLLDVLNKKYTDRFVFKRLSLTFIPLIGYFLFKYKYFHVHSSNVYFRFFLIICGILLGCRSIVTIHGNLFRYKSKLKNYLDILTIKYSGYPILLNEESYDLAFKRNQNARLFSSFIPPTDSKELISEYWVERIINLKINHSLLFCTNAFNFSLDKNGKEIYGIYEILEYFKNNKEYALVFSDPSGAYKSKFDEENYVLSNNIVHITVPHSFYRVLFYSDCSIRNTLTDGDSLSVKESLFLGKITFCTDVVSRPTGVQLYKRGALSNIINEFDFSSGNGNINIIDGSKQIINLYKELHEADHTRP